ncbi:MAG: MBL fold metallo-hydrolase [Ilumatobacteraceae bacterium]
MTSHIDEPLQWQVGSVTITRIEESITPVPAGYLVVGLTAAHIDAQRPWVSPFFTDDGALLLSVHSFVVQSQGITVVVDTCAGLHEGRPLEGNPAFLERIERHVDGGCAGVDVVVCTHLHFDHVGWNTMRDESGAWVPVFPNARYLVTAPDLASMDDADGLDDIASTSVDPLDVAGLLDPVTVDHVINDEIRLFPTPGHTPGHVSVLIESNGSHAVITGDAVHSPIQFTYPELAASRVDHDSDRSTRTRRDLVELLLDTDTLVLGTHFAPPTGGVLRSIDDTVAFVPPGW